MGRPKKCDAQASKPEETEIVVEATAPIETSDAQASKPEEHIEKVSPHIEELMRLYSQYEEIWITPKGFVHPAGTPQYLIKDAKLYKNKYFTK